MLGPAFIGDPIFPFLSTELIQISSPPKPPFLSDEKAKKIDFYNRKCG